MIEVVSDSDSDGPLAEPSGGGGALAAADYEAGYLAGYNAAVATIRRTGIAPPPLTAVPRGVTRGPCAAVEAAPPPRATGHSSAASAPGGATRVPFAFSPRLAEDVSPRPAAGIGHSRFDAQPPPSPPRTGAARTRDNDPLSLDQRRAVNLALRGRSLFITGSAGCGKSVVSKLIAAVLGRDKIAVTATTGAVALQLRGQTIHSWSGLNMFEGTEGEAEIMRRVLHSKETAKRYRSVQTLLIDEVSMLHPEMLDAIDYAARELRQDPRPFGGLQLILVGDFLQLPPVNKVRGAEARFCFEANSWQRLQPTPVVLRVVFRQSDGEFMRHLQAIRRGELTNAAANFFATRCSGELDGVPVLLRSRRDEVAEINATAFAELSTPVVTYRSRDVPRGKLLDDCPCDPQLQLRVGARVMLRWNATRRLVNGSMGTVTGFVRVRDVAFLTTEDKAAAEVFGCEELPLVAFDGHDGAQPRYVAPHQFTVESSGQVLASRLQIPLSLGWAITVHKAQGMSLDPVEMDLGRVFEAGQVYVALSRARRPDGLRVRGLSAHTTRANPKARAFDDRIQGPPPARSITLNAQDAARAERHVAQDGDDERYARQPQQPPKALLLHNGSDGDGDDDATSDAGSLLTDD